MFCLIVLLAVYMFLLAQNLWYPSQLSDNGVMVREARLTLINLFISRFFIRKLYVRCCYAVNVYMVDFILISVS